MVLSFWKGNRVRAPASLRRDSMFNMLGHGLPALLGIIVVPFLIHELGTERFGVLSLLWVVSAYFSLFDLGVGRAITHRVSEALASSRENDVATIATTGLGFMVAMGSIGAAVGYALAPTLVAALHLSSDLGVEAVSAFRMLAVGLPFIVSAQGLHAVLVAYGRFDLVNLIRVPVVSLGSLLPIGGVALDPSLEVAALATVAAQVVGWGVYVAVCLRTLPIVRRGSRPTLTELHRMLGYGGWLTVSNVVAPLMLYLDRFIVARVVSAAGVAYYTTPFGVVTQMWMVPRAVTEALFQRLVGELSLDVRRARATYRRGVAYVVGILVPATLVVVLLARPALALWIGEDFASASFRVAQIVAVAVLINSVGLVATSVIQAAGRPDITAKLHLIEAPLYFIYLVILVNSYGIVGAATAWLIRVAISTCVLTIIANRRLRHAAHPIVPSKVGVAGGSLSRLAPGVACSPH